MSPNPLTLSFSLFHPFSAFFGSSFTPPVLASSFFSTVRNTCEDDKDVLTNTNRNLGGACIMVSDDWQCYFGIFSVTLFVAFGFGAAAVFESTKYIDLPCDPLGALMSRSGPQRVGLHIGG